MHGRVDLPEELERGDNIVGDLTGYFANPTLGNLHLTKRAGDVIGKGAILDQLTDDFDGNKRKSPPNIGADDSR